MSKLKWDVDGERFYETGISNAALYVKAAGAYGAPVAWNGLISASENPTGAEPTPLYADNMKYLNMMSVEEYESTIEAYTYPLAFEACNGGVEVATGVLIGQQNRSLFGLVYKTKIGNDVDGDSKGYKIHVVYEALAAPSEKSYQTINDTPEAITLSWGLTTTAVPVTGYKPTAKLTIDSTKCVPAKLKELEDTLFGVDAQTDPVVAAVVGKFLMPDEIIAIVGPIAQG